MRFQSKLTSLLALGVTALLCSRALFALFNDPEGPNLLIVVVLAAILFAASLVAYMAQSSTTNLKKLLAAIGAQIVLAAGLYFFLG